jgi:hypothetical protein
MAASKLFAEFESSNGKYYKIEIWDEDYSGTSPDEFKVAGDGFQLKYSGQTDNIYSPIIGSSVSFGMYVQDAATIAFLTSIKQYQQDRYYLKIYRGNSEATATFFWGGYIVQDIIEIEDISQPYILNIQATDGISKLADTLCGTSFFRQFTNQFINALDQVGVLGIYGATDPVLAVVCDWWAEEMTYNVSNNPLDETWADFHAFDTIDEDGVITGKTWMEVLEQMCYIFGLRFYYSNGQYRLEQLFERDGSFTEHTYQKDKTKIGATTGLNYTKTLDQTSNKARLAGNLFNFLPAVNNISVVVNKEPKAINGVVSDEDAQPTTEVGFIASTPTNQILFKFYHIGQVTINHPVGSAKIYMKLRLNVELFDFNNNVTYYLKRTYTGMTPGAISWTTTQAGSGYEIIIGPLQEFDRDELLVTGNTSVVTPKVPEDGDVSFDWEFVEFVNKSGATHTLNAANQYGWQIETRNLTTTNGEGITNETIRTRAISPNTNIKSNLSYELPEMNLFTGNGERGSLVKQYNVGSLLIKVPYTNWREGNSGSYIEIQKLVCQEFLKLMDEPIQKYVGQMFSNHNFRQRLTFDGNNWIQLGGTYNANRDEWDGEWFVINRAAITPTFDDVTTKSDVSFFDGVNGITGNTSFSGLDAVNLDTNILDVTTTANVGTDLDVGGDGDFSGRMDIGGALEVVGNSTLAATSVGEFTTTGRVNVTLNEVTGAPGGSETLSTSNNFNFIDFASGENGTYTLNLPSSEPGLIMRFKTDDTIAANKNISLTPQSGERIDGEDSYSMDRPYDGITLMGGPSGDWYIIQKKEK